MLMFIPVGLLALAACNDGSEFEFDWTEDLRVDAAALESDPDSAGTQMCVNREGHVFVLWLDNRNNSSDVGDVDIWMNRSLDKGANWLPSAVRVNQGDGQVENPHIACNEVGVFVVWEDDRDGELENHQVYFQRSDDSGETFMPEDILLENDPDGISMSLEPKLAVNGTDLYVVWYDNRDGAYDILVNTSGDAGLTWRDPVRVDSDDPPGSAYSGRPEIAVSDNGQDVWVVWEDNRDGRPDIYFARSDTGGLTFKEDQRLDSGPNDLPGQFDSFEPQLCTDSTSNVYVVWHDARNGAGRDIYMNYSSNKGADWFNNAARLDNDGEGFNNSLYPVCHADGADLHVAWQDNRDIGYDIYYRLIENGNSDGGVDVRADTGNPAGFANSVDTRLAFDNDTVVVAWRDGRGEAELGTDNGYDDLYYQFSRAGAPFDEASDFRIDSMHGGQSFKLDLSLAVLGGEMYAAWTDGRNGTSDIYFQRHVIGEEAIAPPTEEELAAAQ